MTKLFKITIDGLYKECAERIEEYLKSEPVEYEKEESKIKEGE